MLDNKVILVTGGTGSFGKQFIATVLDKYSPKKVIVFSRDELKQYEMQQVFDDPRLRYFIGDIRDKDRLSMALNDVDVVVHAAALKQVPAAEYNPFEAIKTNVIGAENIISCAIERNVEQVVALSTDKAVSPVNLYGATKLCAEKLFSAGNNYVGENRRTVFSNVRYGNVMGSRGSVIPFFLKSRETGEFKITDERMTRFWITLPQAVEFVLSSIPMMKGGETFVPKIPVMSIMDLADAIGPECKKTIVGIRPGEKIHETLLTDHEARDAFELDDRYIIQPDPGIPARYWGNEPQVQPVQDGFEYDSSSAKDKLTVEALSAIVASLDSKANKVPVC